MDRKRQLYPYNISITPIYLNKQIIGANVILRDTKNEPEKERVKEDYLSVLSHELKTPVTSLKVYNQLLLRNLQNKDDKNLHIAAKMNSELDRVKRLVQNFYDISRVQSGKMSLEKEFFGIDDFINDLVETLRLTYKNRKIRVDGSTGSLVYADKDKIEQVVINLINNAIKYSPSHEEITILLKRNGRKITVGVKDHGVGIPKKFQKRIFERFYQIKADKKNGGLGVGLYIASTIIKFHQGQIWVESKVGKGSTFYFSLPANRHTGGRQTVHSVVHNYRFFINKDWRI